MVESKPENILSHLRQTITKGKYGVDYTVIPRDKNKELREKYYISDSRKERMKVDGLLCWNCREVVPYSVKMRKRERLINGKTYVYVEKYGECDCCHNEITVPGLDDENERNADNLYRAENDIISLEELKEILTKYNIEKRPLSDLLGMGTHTISRYLEGAMPNKKYSDFLKNVLYDHKVMRKYLEENRDKITDKAYEKVDEKLSYMEKLCECTSKIEIIAMYIIHTADEVTDLYLQKMLYFVKAFSMVLLGRDIVEEKCEAWAYGPVFPRIYDKYKEFGREQIPDYNRNVDYSELLSDEEINLINYVIASLGIYNGGTLMRITHREKPWIDARMGLPECASSNNLVDDEVIKEYYDGIETKYGLNKTKGINEYLSAIGII